MDEDKEKKPGLKVLDFTNRKGQEQNHPNKAGTIGDVPPEVIECGNEIMRILQEKKCFLLPTIEHLGGGVFRAIVKIEKTRG